MRTCLKVKARGGFDGRVNRRLRPELATSPSTATKETSIGLQHTGQSSMYDCSGTDKSRVSSMVSQQ